MPGTCGWGDDGSMSQRAAAAQPQAVLTSLAILKTNWERGGRSYVDNLVPFIADCMRSSAQPDFSPGEVVADVESRFGIRIPVAVIDTLLRRASKDGLGSRRQGRFAVDRAAIQRFDLGRQRQDALRRHEALTERLQRLAEEEFGRDLSPEEASGALLAHVEEHSVPLLKTILGGAPYVPPPRSDQDLEYVISAFVVRIVERDPQGFEYLETLVKGSMLATALYLPNVGEVERRFDRNTHVYLDTPVLLGALGYQGEEAEGAARQALELTYELGAQLACFEHTVTELKGVLTAVGSAIARPGRRPGQARGVESYFLGAGYSPTDIDVLIERVEADLDGLRIRVLPKPPHTTQLSVDETQLERLLGEAAGYSLRPTLLHDLDCLTAIYRLRKGEHPSRLESSRAVFVTTNTPMVRVGKKFFSEDRLGVWPPAIAWNDFVTLLWLKRPLAAPELPRKQIVADCYAAMEPGGAVWSRYLEEVERLEQRGELSNDELYILRYAPEAKRALMDQTFGDPNRMSSDVVGKTLDNAKASIQAPILEDLRAAEQAQAATAAAGESAEERMRAAGERLAAMEDQEAQRRRRVSDVRRGVRMRAQRHARRSGKLLLGGIGVILTVSAWLSLPSALKMTPEELTTSWRWVFRGVLILAAGLGVLAAVSHVTPRTMVRTWEVWLARKLEARYQSKTLRRIAAELFPETHNGQSVPDLSSGR